MSFKFNFSGDSSNYTELSKEETKSDPIEWIECEEVISTSQLNTIEEKIQRANMFTCGELEIGHIIVSEALKYSASCDDNITKAEEQHSDLIAGKYEGGMKIWECTSDLIEYLIQNVDSEKWKNAKVLDLGCGAGLLGIMALMNGAEVTFQDYNKEVLESMTIPNVMLNIEEEDRVSIMKKCKFYSGDWACFDKKIEKSQEYDYILTSETIYNCENYHKIINIFTNRLKMGGTVFVAAKTYYFGVGGGSRQFESELMKSDFLSEVVWTSSGGIQREILKLKKK